ncbi:response regulator transcription factor [Candidatus Mycoplasma mahonii]|uniref:response regulator transcription factor n=1 Tax=Candidatus Mycoplasma mahonii TaxID=3004105 RepID=UPI0026EC9EF7|nr:winged helix-turn-helix domain-containing protein [Candidatus Mycoplasma mahonii]WKX02454.1 winged helix-turn-helix domain-containing protein [Candidatus Mycoplasma mahonii]
MDKKIKFYIIKSSKISRINMDIISEIKKQYLLDIHMDEFENIDEVIKNKPHIILFDGLFEKKLQTELVQRIHESKSNARILISQKNISEKNEVRLFQKNVDYVFNSNYGDQYFIHKIRSILRRYSSSYYLEQEISFENLIINLISKVVSDDGQTINLTNTEFKLLTFMIDGKPYLQKTIINEVWKYDEDTTKLVSQYVHRLNKKLINYKILRNSNREYYISQKTDNNLK